MGDLKIRITKIINIRLYWIWEPIFLIKFVKKNNYDMCNVYYSIKSVISLSINENTRISIKCSQLFEKALVYLHFSLVFVRFVNQRQRWKLKPWKWRIFVKFSNRYISKGRILGIYFLMNLPSVNRLWSETSGITNVFCRGYLITDSNGVESLP